MIKLIYFSPSISINKILCVLSFRLSILNEKKFKCCGKQSYKIKDKNKNNDLRKEVHTKEFFFIITRVINNGNEKKEGFNSIYSFYVRWISNKFSTNKNNIFYRLLVYTYLQAYYTLTDKICYMWLYIQIFFFNADAVIWKTKKKKKKRW